MIHVYIDSVEKSEYVNFGSLRITDNINNANDTCEFVVSEYGDKTLIPEVNQEVVVMIDTELGEETIYGGVIISIDHEMDGHDRVNHSVKCKDYSQYMDRMLVIERYTDSNLHDVVVDLLSRYADDYGFTWGSGTVGEDVSISSITFSSLPLSDCFQKIARLTNYLWYVDYDKKVIFAKKNDNEASFNITDDSENFIFESLSINDDFSQIRNKVKIRGGEGIGDSRSEKYAGNGDQTTFPLGSKFSSLPTVTVNGVSKTVGLDFLNNDADYQVMWNYEQKYIRFTTGNTPPAPTAPDTTNILVTGTPLKPIVVEGVLSSSIVKYGVYEFEKKNELLKTRDEAVQYAQAELQAYAEKIRAGSFETYTYGLRSGDTISIQSTKMGVNEKFIIQSVQFRQINNENFVWQVQLATLRTMGIIDLLQQLMADEKITEGEDETLLNFYSLEDGFSMDDEMGTITSTTTEDYVWEQADPESDSYPNPIVWDKFTWA